ncbi:hypothetical protein [Streptomyces soliscabiei]|uniref:hypothetical protein n=1 Tax=Streptomyces soliscabiei TaxID=588897 RepID=UPI0029AE9B68|nr:hypothetical protein [Streptomyces sp. NY05-11A]MDX2681696.1 hypothetical protein [Streptomyces sp. NY05-11A]
MPRRCCGAVASRLTRAGVFAAVCVVTTALGHAVMSGDVLPWWAVGLAFVATAWQGWWLTSRERGAALVVGATVSAQGLLHLLFGLAHAIVREPEAGSSAGELPTVGHGVVLSSSGMAMHMHHSGADMTIGANGTAGVHAALPLESVIAGQGTAGMLLAHLLAAVVCGLWLWRGELAAHQMGRALAVLLFAPLRRIRRLLTGSALDRHLSCAWAATGWSETARTVPAALRHAVVRRGPPSFGETVVRLSYGRPSAVRI